MKRKHSPPNKKQSEAINNNWMIFRLRGCIETLRQASTMPAFVGDCEKLKSAKVLIEEALP